MKFGAVETGSAAGCILAHSTRLNGSTFKKGRVLSQDDISALLAQGIQTVTVARLESGDVEENVAAERIAAAANGGGLSADAPFTGRVNLRADTAGLLVVDKEAVDAMNRIDPALTIATLPAFEKVSEGRMVATAKIIPFAVAGDLASKAEQAIGNALRIAPFTARKVGLVATVLDHLKPATMDKTRRVLEHRLSFSGSVIIGEKRVPHRGADVAAAMQELLQEGADFLILFGASAVVDREDVLPVAVEQAGGRIIHFGMPVDPGNLLLLGDLQGIPVLGAPGCARSPKENGFDWILDRLLAGIPVGPHDISTLGVGGLLMEIGSRPQPREKAEPPSHPRIAAVILGAGRSSRMGQANKLLEMVDGQPLIAHAVQAATSANIDEIVLVTGHMAEDVAGCVADTDLRIVHNPDFSDGMASSIRAGLAAVSSETDAAIIMLGDMPGITGGILDDMIGTYSKQQDALIVAASANGKRGNPVLWDRRFFPELAKLHGDVGGRHIISENAHLVREVEIGDAARIDLDTPEALDTYRKRKRLVKNR